MKKITLILSILALFCFSRGAFAADEAAISKTVGGIVANLDAGEEVTTIKADAFDPYAFIMQEDGHLLVHPTLAGKSLKEKAEPVYMALLKATPEGVWVDYEWQGKVKHTYVKKTTTNLIVGSGY